MPTVNTIKPPETPPEKSAAEQEIEVLVYQFDDTLNILGHRLGALYRQVWGTPDNPRDKAEIEELLNVDVTATVRMFSAHAAVVQALEGSGSAAFENWEKSTTYPVTIDAQAGTASLGDARSAEWPEPAPEPEPEPTP